MLVDGTIKKNSRVTENRRKNRYVLNNQVLMLNKWYGFGRLVTHAYTSSAITAKGYLSDIGRYGTESERP